MEKKKRIDSIHHRFRNFETNVLWKAFFNIISKWFWIVFKRVVTTGVICWFRSSSSLKINIFGVDDLEKENSNGVSLKAFMENCRSTTKFNIFEHFWHCKQPLNKQKVMHDCTKPSGAMGKQYRYWKNQLI